MPRRGNIARRDVLPDPLYNSKLVTRLINNIMLDGKKGVAQKIVYGAFDIVKEKTGKDPLEAFERQLAGTPVQIDCGRVNGRGFLNVSGSGFDVDVLQKTEELKKVYAGEKAYHKAVISVLGRYKAFEAELSVDGKPATHEACTIIEIANGQYIGGGMRVAPEAEMNDGMFDVVVVRKVPRLCIPFLLPLFMLGWHTKRIMSCCPARFG